jgi:hypothetical protein
MIVPGKKYSLAEVARLRARYPDLKLPGMVTRANDDGTIQFIPWKQATGGGMLNRDGELDAPERMFASSLDDPYGDLPAREKRDPRVQLRSLMDKVRPDFMAGRVLSRAEVAKYVDKKRAKAIKAGAALTEDDFAAVMKTFIKRAEDENEAIEAKKVVRTSPSD